jgi:hypothetical protein
MEGRITMVAPLAPRPIYLRDGAAYQADKDDLIYAFPIHEQMLRDAGCVDVPAGEIPAPLVELAPTPADTVPENGWQVVPSATDSHDQITVSIVHTPEAPDPKSRRRAPVQ